MAAERALHRLPIVASIVLHAAVIAPVLLIREPPGLAEGTGRSGLVVALASAEGATGSSGAEAPDLETIDAGPNPDDIAATMVGPEEIAAEAEPEEIDAAVAAAVETTVAEPEAAEDSEPESVTAAEPAMRVMAAKPETAKPTPEPAAGPPAQAPSEAAEVPLEEVQAHPPQQTAEARPETVETVEGPATTAKAQAKPAKSSKTVLAKSDAAETAARTTTTGEHLAALPKTKAGDGGSAEGGSGTAEVDSAIRRGMTDYEFLLEAWLEKHKKYPRRAKLRNWQGTALLRFTIDRDGNVLDYRIEESSGHAVLDEEVEAMIRRAAPLPPAPAAVQSARLEFAVPVRFFLE
jgi:protein TonB